MRLVCLSNSCENDYSDHGQNQITVNIENILDAANEECAHLTVISGKSILNCTLEQKRASGQNQQGLQRWNQNHGL